MMLIITDLVIITLAVASFLHSYHETDLFKFLKPYTKDIDSTIFMFLVSLSISSLYFLVPFTVPVFIAAGAAYVILLIVVSLNRLWV